jgi:hypothetical protein
MARTSTRRSLASRHGPKLDQEFKEAAASGHRGIDLVLTTSSKLSSCLLQARLDIDVIDGQQE